MPARQTDVGPPRSHSLPPKDTFTAPVAESKVTVWGGEAVVVAADVMAAKSSRPYAHREMQGGTTPPWLHDPRPDTKMIYAPLPQRSRGDPSVDRESMDRNGSLLSRGSQLTCSIRNASTLKSIE